MRSVQAAGEKPEVGFKGNWGTIVVAFNIRLVHTANPCLSHLYARGVVYETPG
jgi:hypothetical protein